MVEDFVLNMTNNNIELRKHCASAIFKCAQVISQIVFVKMRENIDLTHGGLQEEETRALVKSNGGLEPLVALIKVNPPMIVKPRY